MTASRSAGLALSAVLCLILSGCAKALRPVDELTPLPSRAIAAEDASRRIEDAQAALDARTVPEVTRARSLFLEAASAEAHAVDGLVGSVRSSVWLATHLEDRRQREDAAVSAVRDGQLCRERDPSSARCRYWLAIGVGVQARERRSTGIDGVKVMVELLTPLVEEAPDLDHAGPSRVLALVYLRAPGWPTGPGDPDLGLEHARAAVQQAPEYPPNHSALGEALSETGDREGARAAYREAERLARAALDAGEPEAAEWLDEARRGAER